MSLCTAAPQTLKYLLSSKDLGTFLAVLWDGSTQRATPGLYLSLICYGVLVKPRSIPGRQPYSKFQVLLIQFSGESSHIELMLL